ncbi:MAG: KpsF/GutQ family sugar-phosphate isomerase [Planctomycetes bacterium]|nr:KpsF/GutQ family sugar-phosphate isomerase [Planctomycetota bacterium]MCH9725439.1 KpsF/GutQ family sugar-phosphate isomerase [Planctomycetota bacterium]MCH9776536.1 KpsF/GutQ family sugar-phosphate isomerase [Planctomycetota bacterium]MCH9789551.1 KpsF/GutQ family sugar-phosphate isomerase [Planctomycetota bacterium]
MSSLPLRSVIEFSQFDQLRDAREIIFREADALREMGRSLSTELSDAVDLIRSRQGAVILTGMGKAGIIAQKICATLSSTGTRSHFLHPAEAIHGDLGCLHSDDTVLALSNSGETEEIRRLLPIIQKMDLPIIGITARETSSLGRASQVVLCLGELKEAGLHQLAPSTSTTAMLAMGDALSLVISKARGFTPLEFATYHPGGSLGRRLTKISEVMRGREEVRVTYESSSIRETFVRLCSPDRRSGAVIIVDDSNRVTGIFTDSDLVRLLEERRDEQLDRPISEVMTAQPITIQSDASLDEAVELLKSRKLSELPVVDRQQNLAGLIDITDVIGWQPQTEPNKANHPAG